MSYVRQDINGTSPLDMKNLNDNIRYLWIKVFGDINMSDVQDDIKNLLYTNWLQPQGEGNLDASHPLFIRFYVPPNTKEIKSAKLNIMTSRYRVDSDVTSSVPSQTTGTGFTETTLNGGYSQGAKTISYSSEVKDWKVADGTGWQSPTQQIPGDFGTISLDGSMMWVPLHKENNSNPDDGYFLDLFDMNHRHKVEVTIPAIQISDHMHEFDVNVEIPSHDHTLNMGIKEADVAPQNIKCYVNDINTEINLSGDNVVQNDIDIKEHVNIGAWNIIKFTSINVARVTTYGIIELLQNY